MMLIGKNHLFIFNTDSCTTSILSLPVFKYRNWGNVDKELSKAAESRVRVKELEFRSTPVSLQARAFKRHTQLPLPQFSRGPLQSSGDPPACVTLAWSVGCNSLCSYFRVLIASPCLNKRTRNSEVREHPVSSHVTNSSRYCVFPPDPGSLL